MSSSSATWLVLLLAACVLPLDCEVHHGRPTITSHHGDLVLQPAPDKNIYLRPNGPQSSVFIANINVLKTNTRKDAAEYQPSTNGGFDKYFNEPNGVITRLKVLEDRAASPRDSTLLNITAVSRRLNNLKRKITALQNQINNRAKSECVSGPCEHGGTCLNLVDGYHCLCPSNWEGRNCDVDVNECRNFAGTDLGCQNGATCVNKPGTYECSCKPGWYGVHCTTRAKDCSAGDFEMCGYGTCVPVTSGDGIKCICHQGWSTNATSVACLSDVNECESHYGPHCSLQPKVECVNVPGSFRCGACPAGYEGDGYICSDIDECSTRNGGCSPLVTCHNTVGSRVCGACPPGYQGDGATCAYRGACHIDHGGCHSSARCTELPTPAGVTVRCVCPEGMDGDGLGLSGCYVSTRNHTAGCEHNACGTHGVCRRVRSGYTCVCDEGYGGAHCDTPTDGCAGNPCQNGGVCRQDGGSGFRCECTAQYTGPRCQVKTQACGGMLDAEQGTLAYPLSNTSMYNNNAQCAWVIHTDADKVLNVTFSKFIVESTPECSGDFLQLHDGRRTSSPLIGRFCGSALPKGGNIVSSHNYLYLWFHSDGSVAGGGFVLRWSSVAPVCGGELDATTHGHISSPGSPGPYPPNRDCYWRLTAAPTNRIILHFFALDIEAHNNCSFDYLAIYDGERASDPLLGRFCNSTQPPPVYSASSHVLIHFHSDAYGSGNGFQIAYAPTEGVPGCGGYFTAERGDLVSPSDTETLDHLICEYKIKTAVDTKIKLTFKSFNIRYTYRCTFRNLKLYDGSSSDARLVGTFCGTTYPATYTSSSNTLYLHYEDTANVFEAGFLISYETVCEKVLVGDSGVISSPSYPFKYPRNKICSYIIGTEPGKAIQLTFQDFDIEDNSHNMCRYDYVEIRDGADVNATLLGRYCGDLTHTPPVQTATHNFMYIRFVSDASLSGGGFYANYTTVDVACGGIYRDTSGLINHPAGDASAYDDEQTCQWLILAPEGMHIELTWNRFAIEDSAGCVNDYLELVEVSDDSEEVALGKYCGARAPPAFTTSTNRLRITFVSNKQQTHARYPGFSLTYQVLDDRTHCGGNYSSTHGYIRSPGWPSNYERNRECTWVITVPVGQQLALNITDFDLESGYSQRCSYVDYLEIRNGASATSPLIGQYCGFIKSMRITSLANVIYLHFHSDYAIGGRGFNIEYDGAVNGCGGSLTSSAGLITSPNYPNSYHENAECFYRIVTSAGSRIRISFKEIDLEDTVGCGDDYVEVYDGRDTYAPSLGRHCRMSAAASDVETTTNHAFIKFRSDSLTSGRGFALDYVTVCNNNLTGRYGVVESPDYPNDYPGNLNCLWNIQVPKGNKINVTFTHFNIHEIVAIRTRSYRWHRGYHPWNHSGRPVRSFYPNYAPRYSYSYSCSDDYLQTKDNSEGNFTEKLCGTSLPQDLHTTSNTFHVKFVTGLYGANTGFRLEWVSYGCGGHIRKNFGTLALDKSSTTQKEMECEWLIETSRGKSISITFTDIYMLQSNNCSSDAIQVYNGRDTSAPLLSKICHDQHATLESDNNYMLVHFVKLSTLRDVHFTSKFHTAEPQCGGAIKSTSGFITSKNYPRNYENNQDCIWYITVPENHRIEINFIDLDLYSDQDRGASEGDDCGDSVLIYEEDYFHPSSKYAHRICPNSNITQIVTKDHNAMVQFRSDAQGTAKGFRANFTVTCGATISATHEDIITNNQYINHSNRNCTWTIIAPTPDQKISLTLTHISLPKDPDVITNRHCPSAYLRVLDGNDDEAPLIGEYCGRKVPPTIVSRGDALTVQLGTYTDRMGGQFSLHYSPVVNSCGGTLTAEEGSIASPLYPSPYPMNTDCEWTLVTAPGNAIDITFEQFDLEYSEGCNEDYLELRENDGAGNLLGVYCGGDTPTNHTKAAKIYIKFHSNNQTSGQGFLLHYAYSHENDIQGEYGVIASPLYPIPYEGAAEYKWRVSISRQYQIVLTVDHLDIPSHGDVSYNKLTIYNGYDNTAPVLDQFHGVIDESKTIHSTSSTVYIVLTLDESNTGSIFHLTWTESSRYDDSSDSEEYFNCGGNQTVLVPPHQDSILTSPRYPKQYRDYANCEWKYSTAVGRHLNITFSDFELEESPGCFADYILIYTSKTLTHWQVTKNLCTSPSVIQEDNIFMYMKIRFVTDSYGTGKGFQAQVRSECGGVINDRSGEVGVTWLDVAPTYSSAPNRCKWTIKVRPGHTIQFSFVHFNITKNDDCRTTVVLRNGDSEEAPLLASGRYCGYEHEQKTNIETSSNALFVRYTTERHPAPFVFQSFKIYYEEKSYECGATSKLTPDHKWEIITSANYPSVPMPYSECEWTITGPPGDTLRIDFIDTFDVDNSVGCGTEVVEIRDGTSSAAPSKGRYCAEKPGTIKTSGNSVYIKYSTQLAEPRHGFKANISIDVCGGTIIASAGELQSPGYPHMHVFPYGTVCEWRIIGEPGRVFSVKPRDIQLPGLASNCSTKVDIEDALLNKTTAILKTFCGTSSYEDLAEVVNISNNFTIKLSVGKPLEREQISEYRGFRISYSSTSPQCEDKITSTEGYLTTPNYPQQTTVTECYWQISLPDKSRRISLELIDIDTAMCTIVVNDHNIFEVISDAINDTAISRTYEGLGHQLNVMVWINHRGTPYRFKAKFTSDLRALCGGQLSGITQEIVSPDVQSKYACEWHYNGQDAADSRNDLTYSSIFITANFNTSVSRTRCDSVSQYSSPKIRIKSPVSDIQQFLQIICENPEESYRIPSTILDISVTNSRNKRFYFHLFWKLQPCGGTMHTGTDPINIINTPDSYHDTLDCAWAVIAPDNNRIEFNIEGSFTLGCDDEYITIAHDMYPDAPNIGRYCRGMSMERPLIVHYPYTYIQYHSKVKNNTGVRLTAKTVTALCGGWLTSYERTFTSPNYPKVYRANEECVWEISAQLGYRVSLEFVERFAVEDTPNCKKDVVIIYDWKDDAYEEMARLCGRQASSSYNSTHNRLKVVLRTDATTNLDGFKARWTPICGGNLIATETEQILYSPNYPLKISNYMHCSYKLYSPDMQKILLKFIEFDMETYPDCKADNLTVTARRSAATNVFKVFCGDVKPKPLLLPGEVFLEFKTDSSLQSGGFKISYSIYKCGGRVNDSTVITSSFDDDKYDENMNCTWLIEAPPTKIVVVKLLYIDVESDSECIYDYVALFDGVSIDVDKRLALLCGYVNSTTTLTSTGNHMVLEFISDHSRNYRGFKAVVYFSYSEADGCGGKINLEANSQHTLKPPLISKTYYANYLDCKWSITSPPGTAVIITFTKFHIAPCPNVNQTAIGQRECDCDFVEIKDGLNPNSLVIGTYCGHALPPQLTTSANVMSVRLSTDAELASTGFEATLRVQQTLCGDTHIRVSFTPQRFKSPGYDAGAVAPGLHCVYHLDTSDRLSSKMRITVINLELRSPVKDRANISHCLDDRLIISSVQSSFNITYGNQLIMNHQNNDYFSHLYFLEESLRLANRIELCGHQGTVDFYVFGHTLINLITSFNISREAYRGVEIEVVLVGFCGRNYTEPQGRIISNYGDTGFELGINDCFTLITAPENYTITAYFINISPVYDDYGEGRLFLDIFDGNNTSARRIVRIQNDANEYPVFSTGRYMLLQNRRNGLIRLPYDLNYVTTNKGSGCGGKLSNIMGAVTSPLFPSPYRRDNICEWVLETPVGTRLMIRFKEFDLGVSCEQNYLQLVDSGGAVVRSFCAEPPADFTSDDNYLKLVFYTTRNNAGRGWSAQFVGTV